MKKLIAISVVFALLTTAVFAQPSIGGNMKIGTALLKGTSVNEIDETIVSSGGATTWDVHTNVNFGDANAGGMMRLWSKSNEWQPDMFTFWWWRPNQFFRMQLGQDADGALGHAQLSGWGFNGEPQGSNVALDEHRGLNGTLAIGARNLSRPNISRGPTQFAPGVNTLGLLLSGYPIDGLQVDLFIPGDDARVEAVYSRLYLNVSYMIEEVGTVRLAAKFGPGHHNRYVPNEKEASGEVEPNRHWRGNDELANAGDMTTLWAAFHLTAIENLGAEIGIGYRLPYTTQDVKYVLDRFGESHNVGGQGIGTNPNAESYQPVNMKNNFPVSLGLGANYNAGDLRVQARAGLSFGGNQKIDAGQAKSRTADREAKILAGQDVDHIPENFYLNSGAFYEMYTDTAGNVTWINRAGEQEVKRDPFVWALTVKPSYKLGEITVFFQAGIGMKHYADQVVRTQKRNPDGSVVTDANGIVYEEVTFKGKPGTLVYKGDTVWKGSTNPNINNENLKKLETVNADFDWFINPYVTIPAGSGRFYAGFKLFTDGTRIPIKYAYDKLNADAERAGGTVSTLVTGASMVSNKYQLKWEIPIGWNFYF